MTSRKAETPNPEQMGRALRRLRVEHELTLEELAKTSELHWTYLSGIERGRRNPTLKVLAAVAGALEIRTSELVRLAEELGSTRSARNGPKLGP